MIDTPQLAQTTGQQPAVIHFVIPRSEIQTLMHPAIREVMTTLAAQGIASAGPVCALKFPRVGGQSVCAANMPGLASSAGRSRL